MRLSSEVRCVELGWLVVCAGSSSTTDRRRAVAKAVTTEDAAVMEYRQGGGLARECGMCTSGGTFAGTAQRNKRRKRRLAKALFQAAEPCRQPQPDQDLARTVIDVGRPSNHLTALVTAHSIFRRKEMIRQRINTSPRIWMLSPTLQDRGRDVLECWTLTACLRMQH